MKTSSSIQNLPGFMNIVASLAFFFGSMLFLPQFASYATVGVWLFMTGSLLMFGVSIHALRNAE